MPNKNARAYVGKFNIAITDPYANKIYNAGQHGGESPLPPDEGDLIQDNGFQILQDNGFPILYTT
jgi:hypothetical protein